MVPSPHHYYEGRKLGLSLAFSFDSKFSTCVTHLAIGQLKCLTFSAGVKTFFVALNVIHTKLLLNIFWTIWVFFGMTSTLPPPLLVIDIHHVNRFLDLVWLLQTILGMSNDNNSNNTLVKKLTKKVINQFNKVLSCFWQICFLHNDSPHLLRYCGWLGVSKSFNGMESSGTELGCGLHVIFSTYPLNIR